MTFPETEREKAIEASWRDTLRIERQARLNECRCKEEYKKKWLKSLDDINRLKARLEKMNVRGEPALHHGDVDETSPSTPSQGEDEKEG